MDRVTTTLLGVMAVLGLALAMLWFGPGPLAAWRTWSAPNAQAPALDDVQTALLTPSPSAAAAYPAVLERPLLLPSRRPEIIASAAVSVAPPSAIEQVKLLGIVAGPTLTGVLLEEQGKPRFVRRNESVGAWALSSIEGRTAIFMRGAERKQIELPYAYGGVGAPPPAGPSGPGTVPPRPVPGKPAPTPPLNVNSGAPTPAPAPTGNEAVPEAAFGGSVAPTRVPEKGAAR